MSPKTRSRPLDVTIYDAVGHGQHAALLSAVTIASLRHSRRTGLDLPGRLDAADHAVASMSPGDFVTAQLGALSTTTGELSWVNAGHPPPLLVRNSEVVGELHCPPRPPIGLQDLQTTPTAVANVALQTADRVLFYTDGLIEGGRRGGERFGIERLAELLGRAGRDGYDCGETVRRLGHASSTLCINSRMMRQWCSSNGEAAQEPLIRACRARRVEAARPLRLRPATT